MSLKGKNILSTEQFNKDSLLSFFEECHKMEQVIESGGNELLKGKVMATLFFEPSTRTRFSFEVAMQRLGGKVVSNPDMMKNSSVTKYETLIDTGKVVSQMVDVVVMRHPDPHSVSELAKGSDVPVINAGDGPHQHPTQGLLDLYTIWKEKRDFEGLTIGMIGDLKNSRVQHSQCELLKHFGVNFLFVAPGELRMPREIKDELVAAGRRVDIFEEIEDCIDEMDVISVSRVQKERFDSEEEYEKYRGVYVLDKKMMNKAKEDAIVIHPLPRVDELPVEVDSDKRAKYWEQVGNGVAVRAALLKEVLGF